MVLSRFDPNGPQSAREVYRPASRPVIVVSREADLITIPETLVDAEKRIVNAARKFIIRLGLGWCGPFRLFQRGDWWRRDIGESIN